MSNPGSYIKTWRRQQHGKQWALMFQTVSHRYSMRVNPTSSSGVRSVPGCNYPNNEIGETPETFQQYGIIYNIVTSYSKSYTISTSCTFAQVVNIPQYSTAVKVVYRKIPVRPNFVVDLMFHGISLLTRNFFPIGL